MIIHNWHSCLQTIVHVQVNTSLSPTQHGELFWGHFFRQELESHQFGVPSQLRKAKTPSKDLRGDLHSVLRHGSMSSQAPISSIYSYGIAIYLEVVSCSLFFSLRRVQSKDQGKQNTFMILLGGALTRGNDPIFDEYFSDGLKAPTGPTTSWNPRGHPRIRLGAAFGWEPNSTQAFPDYNSSR